MSSDAPKGFDKFFKPPKSTSSQSGEKSSDSKGTEKPSESSSSKLPPSKSASSSAKDGKKADWDLGMFSPSPSSKGSSSQGQGRPIGSSDQNPEQNKMIFYAALGFIAFIGALTYFELGYKEISWKDFTNKYANSFHAPLPVTATFFKFNFSYLGRGIVERLEVVNKKWVRVKLSPGNATDGILWFNIGSVDSFERNLENAQADLNIEPVNYIPVIYKSEIEAASLTGLLPTLLIIGFLIYMMRRSADMMGGGRGRKGGGLFGGVMQSTAKFINPSEIGVKFS